MLLQEVARERSTYVVRMTFRDARGELIAPDTLVWSLYDGAGEIVNNRDKVAVVGPASTVEIVLTGADLAMDGLHRTEMRMVLAHATYDAGKTIRETAEFYLAKASQ